jgi:hypothetical protein
MTAPSSPRAVACEAPTIGAPVLRLLTRLEFENTLRDVFPAAAGQWTNALPSNSVSGYGFDNDASSSVGNQMAEAVLETAEAVATAVSGSPLATLLPCSADNPDRACAEEYLELYGTRLFRRPLTEPEVERYLAFFDGALSQTDFATAVKWVTVGLIQSPHAIYRSEIGIDTGDGARTLTAFEAATQLAYTFTSTTPSEALLNEAESGALSDPVATATALVATERGKDTLQRFFEAYVGYPRAQSKQKPNAETAGVAYDDVSADMTQETRAFIQDVVFTQGGTWTDLLTSPTTNPSRALAEYYGMPAPASDFAQVSRPAGHGVGLLAQGAFLATHANSDGSSPTQRGLFAHMRLMCQAKPEVPANVPELAGVEPGVQTTRQRYEDLHAADTVCGSCHALFDPIGFGFEHFDEAGRYRETEDNLAIDSSGSITTPDRSVVSFTTQEELVTGLAQTQTVQECFAAHLSTFAFGNATPCLGSSQVAGMRDGSVGVAEAFAALAGEPHFTRRRAP